MGKKKFKGIRHDHVVNQLYPHSKYVDTGAPCDKVRSVSASPPSLVCRRGPCQGQALCCCRNARRGGRARSCCAVITSAKPKLN